MEFKFSYDCKHSFGHWLIEADTKEQATEQASKKRSIFCTTNCKPKLKLIKTPNPK